jgi:hypothetical protein
LFRRQFETVAEHNCWTRQEKSTAFAGPSHWGATRSPETSDLWWNLGVPGGPSPDRRVAQSAKIEEPGCQRILARITTAVELLAHLVYPALPEDHIKGRNWQGVRRRVRRPFHKKSICCWEERTVNEALRQALDL